MPSSHASSLFYLATFACAAITYESPGWFALGLQGAALALSALRIILGFHTLAQVAVGCVLGASIGVAWFRAAMTWTPWLQRNARSVHATALVCALAFALINGEKWLIELRKTRASM